MKINIENVLPEEIEKRSFEIISQELGERNIAPENEAVVKRVIHTSADFDYYDNMCFSENAVQIAIDALKDGAVIVSDTKMAQAGINKVALAKLGSEAICFIGDEDVAMSAKTEGTTRATASMNKAAKIDKNVIFAIGNAPTALIRLYELIEAGEILPKLIIGAPVGFVNVVESKELIMRAGVPFIVARGRKGGSNVAAAICNAILYQATSREI